jgi:hypothetical protein
MRLKIWDIHLMKELKTLSIKKEMSGNKFKLIKVSFYRIFKFSSVQSSELDCWGKKV